MSEYIDDQAKRKETLKGLIKRLHEGSTVDEVKDEFAELLRGVGATEVAQVEQALIDEGLPAEEVKRLCDVHVAVFRDSLDVQAKPETIPGHPVHTFRAENVAAAQALDEFKAALEQVLRKGSGEAELEEARARLADLRQVELHYLRKENLLFPFLEKHQFSGPSSVMWAIHDDIRASLKALAELLEAGFAQGKRAARGALKEAFEPLDEAMREMFYKEENILFPTALDKLSEEEWLDIRSQEVEIGFCYVEPGDEWPTGAVVEPVVAEQVDRPAGEMLQLDTGSLTLQQIRLLLGHLPVDITFVDHDDTVRFFSFGEERIFARSAATIGRKVQNCHPPASVHRVQQILDDFRAGTRDEAEFWIQMKGRFIHIRYFALRDDNGVYQGTLEVTQDVTSIRELEGERRLLDKEE
jgi:DUF438 domain-containing protein